MLMITSLCHDITSFHGAAFSNFGVPKKLLPVINGKSLTHLYLHSCVCHKFQQINGHPTFYISKQGAVLATKKLSGIRPLSVEIYNRAI